MVRSAQRGSIAFMAMCIVVAALLGDTASSQPPTGTSAEEPLAASGPITDRVGFPKDYKTRFKVLGVVVREEAPEVLTAYGNEQAAAVDSRAKLPYPHGSILVMEFSYALKDSKNQIMRDANGKVRIGSVEHVDVMRRGEGFGEAYGASRSGEWEYAGYRLDGSYTTTPEKSVQCAACHRGAGPENDFVFRMSNPAPPGVQ